MVKITSEQYKELKDACDIDSYLFHEKLMKYTGITRVPYTAFSYFDDCGNYIGDSDDFDLDAFLEKAYVIVDADGERRNDDG